MCYLTLDITIINLPSQKGKSLKTGILGLESPGKVLEFCEQKCVRTLFISKWIFRNFILELYINNTLVKFENFDFSEQIYKLLDFLIEKFTEVLLLA